MSVCAVYHKNYFSDIGNHVFPTEKYRLVYESLKKDFPALKICEPMPVTREQLLRVHTLEYLDDLNSYEHTTRTFCSELPISKEIVDAFYLMTGGSCLAAALALKNGSCMNIGGGFHHAFADRAEGFCYVNDVAVAVCDVLAKNENIKRASIIDTDLHQGNGTAKIFEHNSSVFTFSIHQEHNYPIKERSNLDIGLADQTGDSEYLAELDKALESIFADFKPQFVAYVAGVDP